MKVYSDIGSIVYDTGYVYDSHFPANALLLEVRLTDRQMSNTARDDRRGISPRKTCNKQSIFADDDRHSLMVMHYENCIDNSASFYALYDRLFLVEGQFNEAAAFTLSPLIIDNLQYLSIGEGTIMMWVKRLCTERGIRYYLIDAEPFKSTDLIDPKFSLYIDEKNRLTFEITGYTVITGTAFVREDVYAVRYPIKTSDLDDTSRFNHVAITWKNNSIDPAQNFMRLYINGSKQSILKYDTGAKFGVAELTEEEQIMGDYIDHAVIGPESCFPGGGSYCAAIGTPITVPNTIPPEVVSAFAHSLCPGVDETAPEFADCLSMVTADRLLYDSSALWDSNIYGETVPGSKDGKWVVLKNNAMDPTKDQVRQILANTGQYLLLDRPWDSNNLPVTNPTATYTICGHAYFVTARLDKFMQTRLPTMRLSPDITGLFEYYSQYVLGKCEAFPNAPDLTPSSSCKLIWPATGSFDEWIEMLNYKPSYKYDSVPTNFVDIRTTGQELRHLSVVNTANLYDFPRIYVGSDKYSKRFGNVAMDQLAFYGRALTDEDLSIYYGPAFINTSDPDVVLGYDFDATSTPVYKFTTLQDEKGRAFETYINVLNPFNLPIDRDLLTNLLNMIKPANSTFYINYT